MTKLLNLNTGAAIPWLGFGTGTALFGKDTTNLVRLAIGNKVTHLDGAQAYNNEDTLGAGIRASGKTTLGVVHHYKAQESCSRADSQRVFESLPR
jgi:diketogulonate reductase-like aldo/keto reductase